jgi:hypothetical protein
MLFHMNGFSENQTGHGVISYDSRETHKNGCKRFMNWDDL